MRQFRAPASPPEAASVYCTPSPKSKATTPSPVAARTFKQQSSSPLTSNTKSSRSRLQEQQKQQQQEVEFPCYNNYENNNNSMMMMMTSKAAAAEDDNNRLLLRRRHDRRQTSPAIWCSAFICLAFSLLVILFGIATLMVFLVVKPRTPFLDTNRANLSLIYLFDNNNNNNYNLNGDFTFMANFSNPNRKLHVRFQHSVMELLFQGNLIATQSIGDFSQRPKETGRVLAINFVSSLVALPPNTAMELRKQVLSNKVMYSVRGTFKVRASFGNIHFSYWLHSLCDLQITSPPEGSLVARTCHTNR